MHSLERIEIPAAVLAILTRLEEAGFETWCVGGAIRDALVGDPQQDVDLATAATPADVRRLFRRTVPVGIEHGTVGVLDDDGVLHEVTTFRRDVRTDGRHAVVEFGVSLDEDLARRDFTINAIAWHPLRREWRDPFNGRADIEAGIIRAVGDPLQRFREDRLRILRALRFAARFNFQIDPATWQAARAEVAGTAALSAERVHDEWWKSCATAIRTSRLPNLWRDSGVADVWLCDGEEQDVDAGLIDRLRDPVLILAAWRRPVEPVLRRLKSSGSDISRGRAIDRGPAHPEANDARSVRRWMARVGPAADDLAALAGDAPWVSEVAGVRARGEATSRAELAVTGDDLVAGGVVEPGPSLGRLFSMLLEAVLEDPSLNNRDRLLELARNRSDE
jgi:tRNA nucleotidyltransferase (CCA-adding enzyme)